MVGMTGLVLASTYVKYAFQNLFLFLYGARSARPREVPGEVPGESFAVKK
jgi:hypothetical protein